MFVASGVLYLINGNTDILFGVDLYENLLFHVELNSRIPFEGVTAATYDHLHEVCFYFPFRNRRFLTKFIILAFARME